MFVWGTIRSMDERETRRSVNTRLKPYRLLDAARGCAALWVVMLHVSLLSLPHPIYVFSSYGLLGVQMFFVISGYCIASAAIRSLNAPRPVAHFLTARLRRIYPPYFFASLIALLLSGLLTLLIHRHVIHSSQLASLNIFRQGWRFYLGAVTMTQISLHTTYIIPVFWTLCYEAAFYAIVAVSLFITRCFTRTEYLLDALGILTLGALLWRNFTDTPGPFPISLWPQFGLGILVYQILTQPERRHSRWLLVASGLLIVFYSVREGIGGFRPESDPLRFLFCLAFALLLLSAFRLDQILSRSWPARLLSWIGTFSYSLYLIHLLALGIINQLVQRMPALASQNVLLYLIKIVTCVAVGWLFFQLFEKPFLTSRQRQAERMTH